MRGAGAPREDYAQGSRGGRPAARSVPALAAISGKDRSGDRPWPGSLSCFEGKGLGGNPRRDLSEIWLVIAIDTNLLVFAHRADSEWHTQALHALVSLAEGRSRSCGVGSQRRIQKALESVGVGGVLSGDDEDPCSGHEGRVLLDNLEQAAGCPAGSVLPRLPGLNGLDGHAANHSERRLG